MSESLNDWILNHFGRSEAERLLLLGEFDREACQGLSRAFDSSGRRRISEKERWRCLAKAVQDTEFPSLPVSSYGSSRWMSSLCPILDRDLLGGLGLPLGSGHVVELVGEAGSGKTQWALQLAISCGIHCDSPVIFISTERSFPSERLVEIAFGRCHGMGMEGKEEALVTSLVEQVIVESVRSISESMVLFESRLEWLVSRVRAKLIVVDSIAGVFRYEVTEAKERAPYLYRVARALKRIGSKHEAGVILLNHVVEHIPQSFTPGIPTSEPDLFPRHDPNPNPDLLMTKKASLGMLWSSCINTRIFLSRGNPTVPSGPISRRAQILFSSYLPQDKPIPFRIEKDGVHGFSPRQ